MKLDVEISGLFAIVLSEMSLLVDATTDAHNCFAPISVIK